MIVSWGGMWARGLAAALPAMQKPRTPTQHPFAGDENGPGVGRAQARNQVSTTLLHGQFRSCLRTRARANQSCALARECGAAVIHKAWHNAPNREGKLRRNCGEACGQRVVRCAPLPRAHLRPHHCAAVICEGGFHHPARPPTTRVSGPGTKTLIIESGLDPHGTAQPIHNFIRSPLARTAEIRWAPRTAATHGSAAASAIAADHDILYIDELVWGFGARDAPRHALMM